MGLQLQRVDVRGNSAALHLFGRIDVGDLQRGASVLLDRAWIPAVGVSWFERCGRMVGLAVAARNRRNATRIRGRSLERVVEIHGQSLAQSDGSRMVRDGDGTWLRALVWLLVHGLPGRAAGDGGEFHVSGSANSADRGSAKDVLSVPGDPSRDDRHRVDISSGRERLCVANET